MKSLRKNRAESNAPALHRFVRHPDSTFGQQILNLPITEAETIVQPYRVAEDAPLGLPTEGGAGIVALVADARALESTPVAADLRCNEMDQPFLTTATVSHSHDLAGWSVVGQGSIAANGAAPYLLVGGGLSTGAGPDPVLDQIWHQLDEPMSVSVAGLGTMSELSGEAAFLPPREFPWRSALALGCLAGGRAGGRPDGLASGTRRLRLKTTGLSVQREPGCVRAHGP